LRGHRGSGQVRVRVRVAPGKGLRGHNGRMGHKGSCLMPHASFTLMKPHSPS
jgi:hypothetical protein